MIRKTRVWLRRFLGHSGFTTVRTRNWTLLGVSGVGLGAVADFLQIFNDVALYAFLVSLTAFLTIAALIRIRIHGYAVLTKPLFISIWFLIVFGATSIVQAILPTSGEHGVLISAIQRIEKDTTETREIVSSTQDDLREILDQTRNFPPCDDRDVHLQLMASARESEKLPDDWTLKGSTGRHFERGRGQCATTLLFIEKQFGGRMTEVSVNYSVGNGVIIDNVSAIRRPTEDSAQINLGSGGEAVHYNVVGPEELMWFGLNVRLGASITIEVGPEFRPVAATVVDIGDMRQNFSFKATVEEYRFFVSQLFRSVDDEEFWVRVAVE